MTLSTRPSCKAWPFVFLEFSRAGPLPCARASLRLEPRTARRCQPTAIYGPPIVSYALARGSPPSMRKRTDPFECSPGVTLTRAPIRLPLACGLAGSIRLDCLRTMRPSSLRGCAPLGGVRAPQSAVSCAGQRATCPARAGPCLGTSASPRPAIPTPCGAEKRNDFEGLREKSMISRVCEKPNDFKEPITG